jgi:hypothetical protein
MTDTPTPRRPRFSLRELLMLMALVAMAITIVLMYREVGPLRAEVKKLRDESGKLWVDDATKVNVVQVDTRDERLWKWRVWLPKGYKVSLHSAFGEIPEDGFPQGGFGGGHKSSFEWTVEESEEYVCTMKAVRDKNGEWKGYTEVSGSGISRGGGGGSLPWLDDVKTGFVTMNFGTTTCGYSSMAHNLDKPLILIRHRVYQGPYNAKKPPTTEELMEGFMLWFEFSK